MATDIRPELAELAAKLAGAKKAENDAKADRIKIEESIAQLVETEANGSKTVDAGNGLKITVKRAMGYKADVTAIRELSIPEEVMPLALTEPRPAEYIFDPKAYENVVETHPDVAAKLAGCVEVVPRKVQVSLKVS